MIETIRGKLTAKLEDSIILESRGLGLKVLLPKRDLLKMPKLGSFVKVATHLSLRIRQQEVELLIFGFLKKGDRDFFRVLLKKDHIGVKIAFLILNFASAREIKKALARGDESFFLKCKGLPRKIIKNMFLDAGFAKEQNKKELTLQDKKILEALKKFGFQSKEATDAIRQIPTRLKHPEKRLKAALKILSK